MKNCIGEGRIVSATAPVGGVVSGNAYLIANLFGLAITTAAAEVEFSFLTRGVVELPKKSADNLTKFLAVYWDNTNKEVTLTAAGNTLIGVATSAAAASTTKVTVRLNGVSV